MGNKGRVLVGGLYSDSHIVIRLAPCNSESATRLAEINRLVLIIEKFACVEAVYMSCLCGRREGTCWY